MMTWEEFKKKVESLGVKDTDYLYFIDANGSDEITVEREAGYDGDDNKYSFNIPRLSK